MVIVEISGGEFATRDESQARVDAQDIRHSVMWDEENRNHKNYGITSWPAACLIGADRKVFWQGNPARMQARPSEAEEFRRLLESHLQAAKKK